MVKKNMEVLSESGIEIIEDSFLPDDVDIPQPDYDALTGEMSDEEFGESVEDILRRQQQSSVDDFELTSEQDGPEDDDDDVAAESAAKITNEEKFNKLTPKQIEELCKGVEEKLSEIERKRDSAKDDKAAALSHAQNLGLNKEAAELGHKFLGWKTEKQDNFTRSFISYLVSNGYDVQGDLLFNIAGEVKDSEK